MTPIHLCDRVRRSCRDFIEATDLVRLVPDGLDALASELRSLPAPSPPTVQFTESAAVASLAANAINFGSGWHDIVRKEPGLSGARTMNSRLLRYIDRTGPMTAARLRAITVEDASQIFGQELDGGALEELMGRFTTALNDLGGFIDTHGGTARGVLQSADHSAVTLAGLLTEMLFYRDVEQVDDRTIPLYKRAQITAADLAREGLWRFDDLDQLTAFADNLVPHVLRLDGAIEVAEPIVTRIGSGQLLAPGSAEEVALRAAAVVSVDELVERIANPGVWAMHVDQWLWERGGQPNYKAVPRPRSRSVFY